MKTVFKAGGYEFELRCEVVLDDEAHSACEFEAILPAYSRAGGRPYAFTEPVSCGVFDLVLPVKTTPCAEMPDYLEVEYPANAAELVAAAFRAAEASGNTWSPSARD